MTKPAHRRIGRILVAGAAWIGLAVGFGIGPAAATDGPMPQTREHVLLAIDSGPVTDGASAAPVIRGDYDNLKTIAGSLR